MPRRRPIERLGGSKRAPIRRLFANGQPDLSDDPARGILEVRSLDRPLALPRERLRGRGRPDRLMVPNASIGRLARRNDDRRRRFGEDLVRDPVRVFSRQENFITYRKYT